MTENIITKISNRWFLTDQLLFMTLMSHEVKPNNKLRHPIRSGQGCIEYNLDCKPEKIAEAELEEHLRAEVIRILLRHPYRRHENKEVAYMASNITLNENYKFKYLPFTSKEIWGDDYKYKERNFEFYYGELINKSESVKSGEDEGEEEKDGDENEEGDEGDWESGAQKQSDGEAADQEDGGVAAEGSALWEEDEFMDEKVRQVLEWASSNMQWGTMPRRLIEELIASLTPKIDYRKIIRSFRASVLTSDKNLTRFRPSRRFGFLYMGKKCDFTTNLLIAVDVSASISDKYMQTFFSAINRFFKYGIQSMDVLQFDTEVKLPLLSLKKAKKTVKVQGRGGTSFQPVVEYFENDFQKRYDGLIIFTDGDAPIPTMKPQTQRKTLWICCDKYSYDRHSKWMSKNGRCCRIEEY